MPSSSVAVILVNFNSGSYLRASLAALACQTVPPERVIVVDNASSDDSLAGVERAYPGVEVLPAGGNLGFAAANNLGIRRADDCRWIALVNTDAFVEPDWLETLLAATQRHPECAAFGSCLRMAHQPELLDGAGDCYHTSGFAFRYGQGQPVEWLSQAAAPPLMSPCAAAALYRRDALIEVGGFDESYFCYLEDVDLAFRLRLAGYGFRQINESVARHVGSAITVRHSDFSTYHGHRNVVWTYCKNLPGPLFWWYLPQHLLLNLAALAWFTWRGQRRVIWRAKYDAMRGLPRVWRQRREIQRRRRASLAEVRRAMVAGLLPLRRRLGQPPMHAAPGDSNRGQHAPPRAAA